MVNPSSIRANLYLGEILGGITTYISTFDNKNISVEESLDYLKKAKELAPGLLRPFISYEECLKKSDEQLLSSWKLVSNDNESDEEGCIYPDMEITINKDGDFTMKNSFNDRVMRIANCKKGEVIKVSYPMISSSLTSHKVQNDFNWAFFRLENTFRDKKNKITLSLPCVVKITYSPIVKVTI